MMLEFAKAITAVEVFALREVRYSPLLGQHGPEAEFKRLLVGAVTRIVEDQLSGGSPLGGRYLDGEDDDDGDGTRLHFWLEQSGSTYRMIIIQFDYLARCPPIVTDAMAILHGERFPICRFVVSRRPDKGIQIEHVPSGSLSDESRAPKAPRKPAMTAKPLVHRLMQRFASMWLSMVGRLGAWRRATLADPDVPSPCPRRSRSRIERRRALRSVFVSSRRASHGPRTHNRRRA